MRILNDLFSGFADPLRLRILNLLLTAPSLCVDDLVRAMEAPQPKISRHLAYLRKRGLVLTRREGRRVHYRVGAALEPWPDLQGALWNVLRRQPDGAEDIERLLEAVDAGAVMALQGADDTVIAEVIRKCCLV